MPHPKITVAFTCLALALPASARAEDKKDWFESEPDESKGETADPETGEIVLAQEEGGAPVAESDRGGWLTEGSIALNAGMHLGLGGKARVDRSGGLDSDNPMVAGIGMQLGGEYVVHKYFAAGGELRLAGVNTKSAADSDLGRDLLIDIMARPRGRYVIESIGLETFGALPIGISFPNINDDKGGDANVGFAIGLDLGATYFLTEKWGVSSSVGWLWHRYGIDAINIATGDDETYHVTIGQFSWFLNAVYAL
jgi:hypothetical protein